MKTRDFEALEYVASSGYWRVTEEGDIETSRDVHGRPTEPPVWRSCTFPSPSKNSSTRKRIWVKGRRVYANRAVWVLTHRLVIPEGYQIDHIDDDSLNDRPYNLQLMDAEGNRVKELANGRVHRFQRCPSQSEALTASGPHYLTVDQRTPTVGAWNAINTVATAGDVSDYIGPAETTAILRGEDPSGFIVVPGRPQPSQDTSLTPLDWRISLWEDIKNIWKAFRGR